MPPDPSVPPRPISLATLKRAAFSGEDLATFWGESMDRVARDAQDAAALLNLSSIALLWGRQSEGLFLQGLALEQQRHYRFPAREGAANRVRLLAFMAPGGLMANTPIEFLVEGSEVELDVVYVTADSPMPGAPPDHDVAMVAVCEFEEHQPVLQRLRKLLEGWPRPVINAPERIARLQRENAWKLLQGVPGVEVPRTVRVDRAGLVRVGSGETPIESLATGGYPIIARPAGSHAGKGLARLSGREGISAFLEERPEDSFCVAPFIDYRSSDGLFRKYRIAVIGGRPYAGHMAISQDWMIHYINAGMLESGPRRAEEARFMDRFEEGFAARHGAAIRAITERLGLEYFLMDCGETRDGRLLLFEADTGMTVHSMDPPDLFPYKPPHMRRLFEAFRAMLHAPNRGGAPA